MFAAVEVILVLSMKTNNSYYIPGKGRVYLNGLGEPRDEYIILHGVETNKAYISKGGLDPALGKCEGVTYTFDGVTYYRTVEETRVSNICCFLYFQQYNIFLTSSRFGSENSRQHSTTRTRRSMWLG